MNQIGITYSSLHARYTSLSASGGAQGAGVGVRSGDDLTAGRAAGGSSTAGGDSVSLSTEAYAMRQESLVIEATFTSVEASATGSISDADIASALGGAYDALSLFEEAGRTEYLDSIANPTDLSAEATADRILGGITGYIFDAFRLNNPDATAEEFEEFFAEVSRGFEEGFAEALDIIGSVGGLTDEVNADVQRTADLVREGLAQFHEEMLSQFSPAGEAVVGALAA